MASVLGQREPSAALTGSVLDRHAPLVAAALACLGILLVHADTAASIAAIWNRSETFAHGWIVVPICLWLAWRNREAIVATPAQPWWPALLVVIAAGALWLVMSVADVVGLRQFALTFMLQGAIVAVVGLPVARRIAFPLAFLLFAVPFGEFMVPAMIDMTADFTVAALQLSGVPVYREGNHFIIPSGAWSVVEACSGLRYLIASVMIGVLYAAISYRSPGRRAAFIAASIVVPLVANWLRAYMIVMLGHLSNNRIAVGVDHLIYGWLFFGLVMGLLFWIGSFWSEDTRVARTDGTRVADPSRRVRAGRFYAVAAAAIAVAALWRPLYAGIAPAPIAAPVTLPPIVAAGAWSLADMPSTWTPSYAGFTAETRQAFVNQGDVAGVQVFYYRDQRKGRELVTKVNQLVAPGDPRWKEVSATTAALRLEDATHGARRVEIVGVGARERFVAYRVYWVDGRLASGDAAAKALLARSRLTGGTGDAALVVVHAAERDGRDVAREALEALWPSIGRTLAAARNSR